MYLYRRPDSRLAAWHGFGEPQPQPQQQRAKQIYAAQTQVRELKDSGFQNIFYDRGMLIVVAFWANSCRPCDAVASTVVLEIAAVCADEADEQGGDLGCKRTPSPADT